MTPTEDFDQKRQQAERLLCRNMPTQLHEKLIALLRPAIALTATPADDAQIPLGASKFGGAPDIPEGFEWPMCREEPSSFLVQINLEEISSYDDRELLPKHGLLSFFFSWDDWTGTAEDVCRILWFDSPQLVRNSSAVRKAIPSHPFAINFEGYFDIQMPLYPVGDWTQEDVDTWINRPQLPAQSLPPEEKMSWPKSLNKILGYGDEMYGGPISSFYGDHDHYPWHSLLQLYLPQFPGGAPDLGDAMLLYFSIHPDDLRERHFHKADFGVGAA